jgi:hypothetical protein
MPFQKKEKPCPQQNRFLDLHKPFLKSACGDPF